MSGSPPQFENYIESSSAGNPSHGEGVMFLDDDPEVLQYLKSLQKKPKPTEESTAQSHAPEEVDSDSEIDENESTDQETSEHNDENMMPDNNCTDKTILSPKNKTPSTKVLSDATNKTNKPSLATKQIEQQTSNLQEKEKSLQKSVSPSSQAASNVLQQSNQSSTDHLESPPPPPPLELNHNYTCCVACQINIDDALEMLRKQNEILLDIVHMQALPTNRTSGNRQDFSLLPKFPLNNPIEIVTFDKNLGNKKIQNQFIEYMTR